MKIQDMVKLLRETRSQDAIARSVGTSQAQIARIEKGQVPNYELGKKIEQLHSQVAAEER